MSAIVTCRCGARFQAATHLAGKQVACPTCAQPIAIPASAKTAASPATTPKQAIQVRCGCGTLLKAKPALVGKTVKCPACQQALKIEPPTSMPNTAVTPPAEDSIDPLGLGGLGTSDLSENEFWDQIPSSDPLGLGQTSPGLNGAHANPTLAPLPQSFHEPRMAAQPQPKTSSRQGGETLDVMTVVTGVVCILFALGRLGSMYNVPMMLLSGGIFSFGAILGLVTMCVSMGIGAAGVGMLTRQEWAQQVGSIAASIYFALLAVSVCQSFIGLMMYSDLLGISFLMRFIASVITQSIAPGLLLYSWSQHQN